MPDMTGNFSYFRGKHSTMNGSGKTISFDTKDLLRSAVRVGKRNSHDLIKHKFYAKMEMRYKIAIILANTMSDKDDKLSKSGVYEFLDPSEKSNTSYYLGLSVAHMLAEQMLGVKWLMHLDVYQGIHKISTVSGTRSRPDLFGMNARMEWYVIEAKGRSNEMESGLILKAKRQTRIVKSINGTTPVKIASAIHFVDDKVIAVWRDPEEFDEGAVSLVINNGHFFEQYYAHFIAAIGGIFDDSVPEEWGDYYISRLDDDGLYVGLLKKVYEAYKAKNYAQIPQILADRECKIDEVASYGGDGTVLVTESKIQNASSLPLITAIQTEFIENESIKAKKSKG